MKKIFTLLFVASAFFGFAQNNVTFIVDMNQYSGSTANGVFVNGTFNGWCGTCNAMTDANSDGIWEATLAISDAAINYKFTVNGWTDQEQFAGGESCTRTDGGFTNRHIASITGNITLDTVCFNSCTGCVAASTDSVDITFQVNTATIDAVDAAGIFIAGGNDFGVPGDHPLTDANSDGVWEVTIRKPKGISGNYTFLNGNCSDWGCKEQLAGKPCGDAANFNDRTLPTITQDTTIQACFGECNSDGTCPTIVVVAADAPTKDIADVISIYSETYGDLPTINLFPFWNQTTQFKILGIGMDSMIAYSNLNYQGINFGDTIDATTMDSLHMSVWSNDVSKLDIYPISISSDEKFVSNVLAADEWNYISIPLSDYTSQGLTINDLIQFKLVDPDNNFGTIYVDDIYFSKLVVNSISAVSFSTLKVYPNPANENVTLNIDANTTLINSVSIINVHGQLMSTEDVNATQINKTMDVSNLTAGVYFVNINTENGTYSHRLLVK